MQNYGWILAQRVCFIRCINKTKFYLSTNIDLHIFQKNLNPTWTRMYSINWIESFFHGRVMIRFITRSPYVIMIFNPRAQNCNHSYNQFNSNATCNRISVINRWKNQKNYNIRQTIRSKLHKVCMRNRIQPEPTQKTYPHCTISYYYSTTLIHSCMHPPALSTSTCTWKIHCSPPYTTTINTYHQNIHIFLKINQSYNNRNGSWLDQSAETELSLQSR